MKEEVRKALFIELELVLLLVLSIFEGHRGTWGYRVKLVRSPGPPFKFKFERVRLPFFILHT